MYFKKYFQYFTCIFGVLIFVLIHIFNLLFNLYFHQLYRFSDLHRHKNTIHIITRFMGDIFLLFCFLFFIQYFSLSDPVLFICTRI